MKGSTVYSSCSVCCYLQIGILHTCVCKYIRPVQPLAIF